MGLLEELDALGADTGDAVKRFMNKEEIYIMVLQELTESIRNSEVLAYFEKGDYENALLNAHALKGEMGNLSLTPLYEGYTQIVALLRQDKPDEARAVLDSILPKQEEIIACIKKYA